MPIILADGKRFYTKAWFAVAKDGNSDVFGAVYKGEDGVWYGEYRFRYYVDDKAFGSKDKKNFYGWKSGPSDNDRDKLLAAFEDLFTFMSLGPYRIADSVDFNTSDVDEINAKLNACPWAHRGSIFGTEQERVEA